jgi:hypothetical protein
MADHKRDFVLGGFLRGQNKIAFVLTTLIVDYDDELTGGNGRDRLFNR